MTGLAAPELRLQSFAGPIDLLLDLVRQQRVDLGRIAIAELAEQFAAALERSRGHSPLERQGEWLVTATWLVLLKSRLLLPASPEDASGAEREATAQRQVLEERATMRRAAAWLDARPQLGGEVFARAQPLRRQAGTSGFAALLEAGLIVFRGAHGRPEESVYRPVSLTLWRLAEAIARMRRRLAAEPGGGPLTGFLPSLPAGRPEAALLARAAVASTFLAGLELAREGLLTLRQDNPFADIAVRGRAPASGEPGDGAAA